MLQNLIKYNGQTEPYIAAKAEGWGKWAAVNLNTRVDWSKCIELARECLPETATTRQFMMALIDQLIAIRSWPAYLMAGRLYSSVQNKDIHGKTIPTIKELHTKLIGKGLMVDMGYTDAEYAVLESHINHNNDHNYPEFSLQQLRGKYSITNRVEKKQYETPQFIYMRMAMELKSRDTSVHRIVDVLEYYRVFSAKELSQPTPAYLFFGTKHRGFAPCCLYTATDTIESLDAANSIAFKMTANSAGLGNNIMTRSLGEPIRGGMTEHCGRVGYLRAQAHNTTANVQAGRGGAMTAYFSGFDPEASTIVQLRNPLAPIDKQLREIHYNMMTNAWFAEKVANGEDIFTFNIFSAPDLNALFYSGDIEAFIALYEKYEADDSFKKNYVSARQLIAYSFSEAFSTGTAYLSWADEMNRHTPFKETIHCSNLCVVGETKILTRQGYKQISSVCGESVEVWNGQEWSMVEVVQTGTDQEVLTVHTSIGKSLTCTPYHKFYVYSGAGSDVVEIRASDLKAGMRLIDANLPVVEGFDDGDEHGYGIAVPEGLGSVASRVAFLNRYLTPAAAEYCLSNMRKLRVETTHEEACALVELIETLGVNAIVQKGKNTSYVIICQTELKRLSVLGLDCQALGVEFASGNFKSVSVSVESVVRSNTKSDTYCFTEPKRGMGVFNGLLTGQCAEITQPTIAYESAKWLYVAEDHGKGEISMCNLAAIPVDRVSLTDDNAYFRRCYLALKSIDHAILESNYPFPHLELTAKSRMNAAVGMMGLATLMARQGIKYSTEEGKKFAHRVAERHMYWLIKASIAISKERGLAPWIHKTKWPEGWTPLETYNRNVDEIADFENQYDWAALSQEIIDNGGIAHSSLCGYMPGESSSKGLGSSNSIYAIRSLVIGKSDGDARLNWAAPDGDILGDAYELCWDIPTIDMIQFYAVFQKWTDQAISADLYRRFAIGEVSIHEDEYINDYLAMTHYGLKTRYYTVTQRPKIKPVDAVVESAVSAVKEEVVPEQITSSVDAADVEWAEQELEKNCPEGFCSL